MKSIWTDDSPWTDFDRSVVICGRPFRALSSGIVTSCSTASLDMESSVFFLGQEQKNFTAASSGAPGSPIIARPFIDANGLQPNSARSFERNAACNFFDRLPKGRRVHIVQQQTVGTG